LGGRLLLLLLQQSRAEQSSPALFLSGLTADERCSTWWRVVLLDWIVLYNDPREREKKGKKNWEFFLLGFIVNFKKLRNILEKNSSKNFHIKFFAKKKKKKKT
jgi:hypothetical protein